MQDQGHNLGHTQQEQDKHDSKAAEPEVAVATDDAAVSVIAATYGTGHAD